MTTREQAMARFIDDFIDAGYEGYEDFPSLDAMTQEARSIVTMSPDGPPMVLIHVDGGIAEEWYTVAGTGVPEVHILDFDREGEDAEDRAEFIERARDTLALFKARGVDTSGLDEDVENMATERG